MPNNDPFTSATERPEAAISAVNVALGNGPAAKSEGEFEIEEDDFAARVDAFLFADDFSLEQDSKKAPIGEPPEIDYVALLADVNAQIEALQRSGGQDGHALGEGISAQQIGQESDDLDRRLGGNRANDHDRIV